MVLYHAISDPALSMRRICNLFTQHSPAQQINQSMQRQMFSIFEYVQERSECTRLCYQRYKCTTPLLSSDSLNIHQFNLRVYPCCRRSRLARGEGLLVDASVGRTGGDGLGLAARGNTLELLADGLDGAGAVAVVDGGRVTEVGVDTSKELAVGGLDVLHDDMALSRLLAVAARPVQLAEVVDGEAVNSDGTSAVLLDDLVFGSGSTTAND